MRIFTSKYIFDGKQILLDHAIVKDLHGFKIIAATDIPANYANFEIINCGYGVITPGFIDLQVNGIGGADFNSDISPECLETMHQANLKFGTVGFLPTLITGPFANVIKALETLKAWFIKYGNRRGVLGIHLEGPFIADKKSGIHPKEFILKPELQYLEQIVAYRKYFPIKMTIAPENFTQTQMRYLLENNIILSIGHSDATYMEASKAISLGVNAITHTFNAMSGLSARNPGVIGAVLNLPVFTGLIADLIHVDSANIQLLYKLKRDLIYLVSDSVMPTGTSIKSFRFALHDLTVSANKIIDNNGTLGGAYLTLNIAIKNCIENGLPLLDTLKMAVITPLKVMHLEGEIAYSPNQGLSNLIYLDLKSFECKII